MKHPTSIKPHLARRVAEHGAGWDCSELQPEGRERGLSLLDAAGSAIFPTRLLP